MASICFFSASIWTCASAGVPAGWAAGAGCAGGAGGAGAGVAVAVWPPVVNVTAADSFPTRPGMTAPVELLSG